MPATQRRKEKTRPLPGIDDFTRSYFNAVILILQTAEIESGEFTQEVREYDPPGALGKPKTTGEQMERRNLQRFLQVLRTTEMTELEGRPGLVKKFRELDAQRRITTKTLLRENYHTGRRCVVSFLTVGPDYLGNIKRQLKGGGD